MPDTATKPARFKLDVPLTGEELGRFRSFCDRTGRSYGPYVRTLILRAMDAETPRGIASLLPDHPEAS